MENLVGTKWKQLYTCAPARCHQAGMHQNQKEEEEEEEEWVRTGRNLEKHPEKVFAGTSEKALNGHAMEKHC